MKRAHGLLSLTVSLTLFFFFLSLCVSLSRCVPHKHPNRPPRPLLLLLRLLCLPASPPPSPTTFFFPHTLRSVDDVCLTHAFSHMGRIRKTKQNEGNIDLKKPTGNVKKIRNKKSQWSATTLSKSVILTGIMPSPSNHTSHITRR